MKKIDPTTLFSLFETGDEQVYEENNVSDVLKNPYVLMGMVVKGIENFFVLDQIYLKNNKEQYEPVRESTKYKYFNKLYGYLKRIDYNKFESKYTITNSYDSPSVNNALHVLLKYFETLEEYEKCAIVKKYIDLLYEYPNKTLSKLV
tara:strand:- start:138 stop:578 length:441 start_codon:yes stop_codon:yes gene_type:complete